MLEMTCVDVGQRPFYLFKDGRCSRADLSGRIIGCVPAFDGMPRPSKRRKRTMCEVLRAADYKTVCECCALFGSRIEAAAR